MSRVSLSVLIFFSMINCYATAQDLDRRNGQQRELLKSISPQERNDLVARNQSDYASHEYFAKPGRIGIYTFDIHDLETIGSKVTITLPDSTPISIISNGIERDPMWKGSMIKWHGEVLVPNSKEAQHIELTIGVRSVDPEGNVHLPDPNREVTIKELQGGSSTVLLDSLERLDETLVYTLVGNTLNLSGMQRIAFRHLGDRPGSFVVYEIDDKKTFALPDAVIGPDGTELELSTLSDEQQRRQTAYEEHMQRVRSNVSSNPNQE